MLFKKVIFLLLSACVTTTISWADSLRISQVDSNSLLLNQEIKLYLSVTNDRGKPVTGLKKNHFRIFESVNAKKYQPVHGITAFKSGGNYAEGISLLLLIDNSESMYWSLEGKRNEKTEQRRITIAKKTVKDIINSINNPNDRVGVALYNSYYKSLSKPVKDMAAIERYLENIERPDGDAIYSEIYGSLHLAVDDFSAINGRKAIIILSDGVNNPSYTHTGMINQQFGRKFVPYQKPLEALQFEGISLYVINFGKRGDRKDRHLKKIAKQSGGATFDAHNQSELKKVYFTIMDQILKEYAITYRATMDPAERKFVKVNYIKGSQKNSTVRFYFSSTVFGQPRNSFNPLIVLSFLLASLLLWLLSKIKFEKQRTQPSVEVLNAGAGKISTRVLTLENKETIIGCSTNADMTIAGLPAVEENHATIVFDEKNHQYTLIGQSKMLVNNKMVTTKVLEPGDLINIDGMTMVFDEGTEKKGKQ